MNDLKKRTWAEISLDNIKYNYHTIRALLPEGCRFLGVVKADAYGHGALEVSRTLQECGADYLAVSCLDEALELRHGGITMPILILGHTPPEYTKDLIDNHLTQTVTNLAKAEDYSREAKEIGSNLKIHIKLDTGMSRLGFLLDRAVENITASCKLPYLVPEGIYTHFSVSDETDAESIEYTKNQFSSFMQTIHALEENGITFEIRHCANSGAVVNHPEMMLDMVRPGLLLYGYGDEGRLGLKPCMNLITTISTIKYYDTGTSVSYGRKYTTSRRTRMAVLAIGYADGLPRASSGKCSYYVAGKYAPQCGNICMDMCMADVTDIYDAAVGSEVELFGSKCSLYSLSDAAGTIPYELLCSVSKRVPRVYK